MSALHLVKTFLAISCALSAASLGALYAFQNKLVYPSNYANGRKFIDNPGSYGLDYEEVWLDTPDGERIQSYVLVHNPEEEGYKNKTVLVLCPNGGNIGHSLPIVKLLYSSMQYNVVIYSYRGYGASSGTASEGGIKIDSDTVMAYLASHPQLSKSALILYGRSLGGAVGIYLAASYPDRISALILENTFLSIRKVIPNLFPFLVGPLPRLCREVWDSESLMPKIPPNIPVLFLSGSKDELVPPEQMKKLYELSRSDHKTFVEFPNGTHNTTCGEENYWLTVHQFIWRNVPGGPGEPGIMEEDS